MWADYDYTNFPIVTVKFNKYIKEENDFNMFLKKWIYLYDDKKDFSFVFDTTNVGMPNIKYCYNKGIFDFYNSRI